METHGRPVVLDFSKFLLGTSFFVPGTRLEQLTESIGKEMRRLHIRVDIKPVVENGILGVRVWRLP
jgi:hypothetical protein